MRTTIEPKVKISDLVTTFPELIDLLMFDYGLHCVNCIISELDTLQEGALLHGIEGKEFDEMLLRIERIVNGEEENPYEDD